MRSAWRRDRITRIWTRSASSDYPRCPELSLGTGASEPRPRPRDPPRSPTAEATAGAIGSRALVIGTPTRVGHRHAVPETIEPKRERSECPRRRIGVGTQGNRIPRCW